MVLWLVKINKDWMVIIWELLYEGIWYNLVGGGVGVILILVLDIVFVRFMEFL